MTSKELMALDRQYVLGTYGRNPIAIDHGKGATVYDPEGNEYIDFTSGIGVNSLGYGNEKWAKAIYDQALKLGHMSNLYYTEPCAKLAEQLCTRTGMSAAFFGNSGAEANEGIIKLARKYSFDKYGEGRSTIITMKDSFHGRTLTTLAATGQEHYHELFQPLTPGFVHADVNDIDSVKKLVAEHKVAAIMFECIQGEGGVVDLDPDFIAGIAKIAEEEDILMVVDEVQTGNGRTGKMYSYMHYGICPDIVSTAKGIGGGLPLAACLLSEKLSGVFGHGDNGTTYGANPVCCAGGVSVVSRLTDEFMEGVEERSRFIRSKLEGAPGVKGVSGKGLILGISTEKPAGEVVQKCLENGVLCLTAKDKVRLLPALNIPMDVLEKAVAVICDACA